MVTKAELDNLRKKPAQELAVLSVVTVHFLENLQSQRDNAITSFETAESQRVKEQQAHEAELSNLSAIIQELGGADKAKELAKARRIKEAQKIKLDAENLLKKLLSEE